MKEFLEKLIRVDNEYCEKTFAGIILMIVGTITILTCACLGASLEAGTTIMQLALGCFGISSGQIVLSNKKDK
jgi:predicted membrane channel-forming protein YqfA (hemolysin III family)